MAVTRTIGKFTIKSKNDPNFSYDGYSKQCEVMFRDYMGWCRKNKAPKALQAEYDKAIVAGIKPEEIFTLEIQPMTEEEFEKAANKSAKKPVVAPADFVPKGIDDLMKQVESGEVVIPPEKDVNWDSIIAEYKAGGKVKDICKREKIAMGLFYEKLKEFTV